MRLTRYLKEEFIRLDLGEDLVLENEDDEPLSKRQLFDIKHTILDQLVTLIDRSGRVANSTKLKNDLLNREKKATMAIGHGVVIPHVRTMQARDMAMAIGVASQPLPWTSPDGEPVDIFIAMVAPPYDDRTYLQAYRRIGELFVQHNAAERIRAAREPGEIIRFLNSSA
ncbi:MAG: PTS sugar transporter subunit IIA [Planctomycetota bacterium]